MKEISFSTSRNRQSDKHKWMKISTERNWGDKQIEFWENCTEGVKNTKWMKQAVKEEYACPCKGNILQSIHQMYFNLPNQLKNSARVIMLPYV